MPSCRSYAPATTSLGHYLPPFSLRLGKNAFEQCTREHIHSVAKERGLSVKESFEEIAILAEENLLEAVA